MAIDSPGLKDGLMALAVVCTREGGTPGEERTMRQGSTLPRWP